MSGQVMSVSQIADRLGVSRWTVRRMIEAGEFPNSFRLTLAPRSPWRVPVEDVERVEQEREKKERDG